MTCGGVPVDDRETNGLMCSLGFLLRCSFARVDCKQIARDDAALKGEANPGSNAQQTPQGHLPGFPLVAKSANFQLNA